MDRSKLVSIITPCYNGENFFQRYIDSILSQTYRPIELILVNDGSKDNSEKIIKKYEQIIADADINLIYLYQENAGVGAAIQNGLNHMTGEYFTWIDIDDFVAPQYLEKAIAFLESNEGYGVVRFNGAVVDSNNTDKVLRRMADNGYEKNNPYMFENAISERNFHFGYSVVKTECFDKANQGRTIYPSRQGQNWQILLPVFYYYKAGYIDEPLYYVCERVDSVSNREVKYESRILQIEEYKRILLETLGKMNLPNNERTKYLKIVNDNYAHRIYRWALPNNDYVRAKREYKHMKKAGILTKQERQQYRSRVKRVEYWMYLKQRLFSSKNPTSA